MTTQLESDVRTALAGRAGEISPDASARLRRIDYRPRGRRVSTGMGVTVGTVVGAAATAGIATAVTLGGSSPAFAGWSPKPSAKTTTVFTANTGPEQSCQSQVDAMSSPPGTPDTDPSSWTPVATDVRGPYTLVVFKSGSDQGTCLIGPSVIAVSQGSANGLAGMERSVSGSASVAGPSRAVSNTARAGKGSGGISWFSELNISSSDGELTLMDGQLAPGVTSVSLVRSDGSKVQATVGDGWFVAWWPGDVDSSSAQVTTASGTSTVALNSTMPKPPAPGSSGAARSVHCTQTPTSPGAVCSGGGTAGASSGPVLSPGGGASSGSSASTGPATSGAGSGPASSS